MISKKMMEELKAKTPVICRQCRKEIKTEAWRCIPCEKLFHPGCHKLHKIYNPSNELVLCNGKTEIITVKVTKEDSTGSDSCKEQKLFGDEGSRILGSSTDNKIDALYKLIKEIKDEILGRDLIKKVIAEAIEEEMSKVKHELQSWKEVELEKLLVQQ